VLPKSRFEPFDSHAAKLPTLIYGIGGSPGLSVGPAYVLGDSRISHTPRCIQAEEVRGETARLAQAVVLARQDLTRVADRVRESALGDSQTILEAYLAMLGDPLLIEQVEHHIVTDLYSAETAISVAGDAIGRKFAAQAHGEAYIAEREHDVAFVCERLLRALLGDAPQVTLTEPSIVLGRDVSPADTAAMSDLPVLGFVTERGSRTSHTAIMARALGVPAVMGAESPLLKTVRTGDWLIVDGFRGTVTLHPSAQLIEDARARSRAHGTFSAQLRGDSEGRTPALASGENIMIEANIELESEVALALRQGAQGLGLFRTEFLYVNRSEPPSEDEQYEIYRRIVSCMGDRPVTLRTFDLGGDKFASAFALPTEMNPALGLRAVRLALQAPTVFLAQLRAMVRASAHGQVRIMIPMVTTLREFRASQALLHQAAAEVSCKAPPLGMMVEVPRGCGHGRCLCARSRVLQHWHQRSRPIRAGSRPYEPRARATRFAL
jgi:phosphoenolpyruvate-protein phosphotransferase (PTS system enzyme I)